MSLHLLHLCATMAYMETVTNSTKKSVLSPLTAKIPNKETVDFAVGLLRHFGDLVLVDTKKNEVASTKHQPEIFALFKQVVSSLASGKAISIVPYDALLTTHQSAHILNVSRPYLISLLEKGEIPFHMVGSHRRIRFDDVIAHKEKQRNITNESLKKLTQLSEDYGLYK